MLKKLLLSLVGINLVVASTLSYAQKQAVEYTNEITDEHGTHYVSPAVPVRVDPATIPHIQYASVTENRLHHCKPETDQAKEILDQFLLWNAALWTEKPSEVVKLYANNAILLPTLSNDVRHTPAEREDYFVHFLQKQPQGQLLECNIRVFGDIAVNSGTYRFYLKDKKQKESTADARFTYVYQRQTNGKWLIIEHHSSLMPEKETTHDEKASSHSSHSKKSEKKAHKPSGGHH